MNFKEAENAPVASIPRRVDYKPVSVECKMEDLIDRALNQNFVPVVDDRGSSSGWLQEKILLNIVIQNWKRKTKKFRADQMGCPVLFYKTIAYVYNILQLSYTERRFHAIWLYATGGRAGEEYGEYCKKTNYEMR